MDTEGLELSVVVPVYNEAAGLLNFHTSLMSVVTGTKLRFEIIYCDDGSTDNTLELVTGLHKADKRVKVVRLSRNFGKESALAAGIAAAKGSAILSIDGDGQHPVELIPQFMSSWRAGAQVVIGVRTDKGHTSVFKNVASRLFYKLYNRISAQPLLPGSTDFRLITAEVREAFLRLHEADRITRGLIDWLGFQRDYISFKAKPRGHGAPRYSTRQLMKLATASFVSLSPTPLYFFGYVGVVITVLAFILGLMVFIEQLILGDPLHWKFTGTAMLGILIVFLVGIVLVAQGILSLYISHIHNQTKGRPLYVINYSASRGISKDD